MGVTEEQPERPSSKSPGEVFEEAAAKDSRLNFIDPANPQSERIVKITFWLAGLVLALSQSWSFRHFVSADAIAYLDMSDFVFPGAGWQRIISGVWSPLYPFLIGVARWILKPAPTNEIAACHLLNVLFFCFCFCLL
jgi:hypothetical protein